MSLFEPATNGRDVRAERTGWRDLGLSERHRMWGWNCPAVDLDFLFLEYDRGKASAIVEYKHENARPMSVVHPTYLALRDLADRAQLPAFVVRYGGDYSWFAVSPINDRATEALGTENSKFMSEAQWVEFLYRLRGYAPPTNVLEKLRRVV